MAVKAVRQGEIVEVSCNIPHGGCKVHMVLVVSDEKLQEKEDGMFYGVMITSKNHNPEYTLEIAPDMLIRPLSKTSYFATHLMSFYTLDEVGKSCRTALKEEYFDKVVNKVIKSIFNVNIAD